MRKLLREDKVTGGSISEWPIYHKLVKVRRKWKPLCNKMATLNWIPVEGFTTDDCVNCKHCLREMNKK